MSNYDRQAAVHITDEMYKLLEDIAKEQDRSLSYLIRIAIEEKYIMDNGNEDKTASIDSEQPTETKSISDMLNDSDYS